MTLRGVPAVACVLAGALPLLLVRPAPLQDWPNHVARFAIEAGLLHGDPFWSQFYYLTGFLVPDAVVDLCVMALAAAGVPVGVAAQLVLLGVYAVFVAGFCACARVLGGGGTAKPAFAVLLFYSNALLRGLVSYTLGLGLLLALVAAWIPADAWRRRAIAAGGAVLLVFTHVVPAVAWVAVLAAFELDRWPANRARPFRLAAGSPCWLLAAGVVVGLLLALPGRIGHDLHPVYSGTGAGGMARHKLMLGARVLLGGSATQDAASLLALLVCAGVAAAGRPRLDRGPALAVAALAALTLAAPERLGSGSLLDTRLAIVPLLLAAAAVRFSGRAGWLAQATVLARTLVIAAQFCRAGAVFAVFDRAAAGLPRGGLMMMAYGTPLVSLSWGRIWSPPIQSIATQVVFRGVFMPHIFANPAQQPIALRPTFRNLTQPWNLADAAHLAAAAASLEAVCEARRFAGVYLTVLYPGSFIATHAASALLHADRDFLLLDACRLSQ